MKEIIPILLEWLTFLSDIFIIGFFFAFLYTKIFRKKLSWFNAFLRAISKNYLLFGLIISLTATLGSLYYSEIMGYSPCVLCWYQRILMYPQIILFGIALWHKNTSVINYIIPLSFIGAVLAAFHYQLQISNSSSFSCSIIGYSASCTEKFFLSFGYITIPMMALTAFALILIFSYTKYKFKNK